MGNKIGPLFKPNREDTTVTAITATQKADKFSPERFQIHSKRNMI